MDRVLFLSGTRFEVNVAHSNGNLASFKVIRKFYCKFMIRR